MKTLPHLNSAIANTVKKIRKRLGITQEELAERSGLSLPYVGQLEACMRGASVTVLIQIARSVGITGAQFLAQVEKEHQRLTKKAETAEK